MQMLNEKFDKVRQELRRRWLVLSVTLVAMDTACAILLFNLFHFRERTAYYTFLGLAIFEFLFLVLLFIRSVRRPKAVALAKLVEGMDSSYQNGLVCAVEKELIPESDRTIFEQLLVEAYQVPGKITTPKIRVAVITKWLKNSTLLGTVALALILSLFSLETDFLKKAYSGVSNQPQFKITPKNLQASIYTDFTVSVEVLRWEPDATISFEEEGEWVSYPMTREGKVNRFTFYNLVADQPFVISTDSLISEKKTIAVFTPPKAEQITVEVVPPSYTKIKPTKIFSFNNITVLEGSNIKMSFAVKPKACQSRILLNKRAIRTQKMADMHSLELQVSRSGSYQLELDDQKGHAVLSPVYSIEVIPDQAPAISVIKPGKDSITFPEKPLRVEVTAVDDFGIRDIVFHASISGKETKQFSYQFKGDDSKLKLDFTTEIDPQKLGAKSGDVIKYYYTVLDNRAPQAQQSRSDIFFLTVIEDLDKKEKNGKGGGKKDEKKKKKVTIAPLITEAKRLIRLSHDSILLNTVDQEKGAIVIAMALSDLRINVVKLTEEIKKEGELPQFLSVAFNDALYSLEVAEKGTRLGKVEESIPSQEVVLNKLSMIAFELSKNQMKMKSECQKPSDSPNQSKGKQKNKNQMKMDLAKLKKALKMLQQQSQAQGKQNRMVKSQLGNSANHQELKALKQTQSEISSKVSQVKKDLGLDPENALSKQLDRASEKSNETVKQLKQNRANQALREGQQTQKALLKAAGQLDGMIAGLIKQALNKMAQEAKDLANKQAELSKKSATLKRSDQAGQKAAKSNQASFKKALNKLRAKQQGMAQQTAELYPKLSEKLFKGLAKLNQSKLDSNLKKVEKGMLYKQFKNAAKYQMKVAKSLDALSKDLDHAKLALPKISKQELMKMLADFEKMQKSLKGQSKDGLSKTQKELQKMIDELAKKMGSKGMNKLKNIMQNLPKASQGNAEAKAYQLSRIIGASMQEVMNQLMKSELDEKIKINKKTFKLPEQYRDSIEEYFKKLSE